MKAKLDYEKLSDDILGLVGGAKNLKKVSHCFTRLRLDPVDTSKIDEAAIKKLDGVKGLVVNNGQYQIILGNAVEDLFPVFLKKSGLSDGGKVEEKLDDDAPKGSLVNRILNGIAQIFIPVFPAIAAGGLLKGILVALMFNGVLDPTGNTFNVLMWIADAPFYFLPVLLAYTSAKVFGCKQMVAVALAGVMIYPSYLALTEATSVFGLTIPVVNYSSTVFPIIGGVYILSWIEKGFKKICPKVVAGLFVPLFSLAITSILMLWAVGPAINWLSDTVSSAVLWVYNATGFVGGAIFGALYPVLVFLGLHHAVVPMELQFLADLHYDPLLAICAAANAAVAGAALMVAIDSKNKSFKANSYSAALSGIIGITEPALYGVLGVLKKPFIGAAVGGAVGGAIMAIFKVTGSGLGPVPGAGFALFLGNTKNFIVFLVGTVVSVAVAMVVTHILKFQDVKDE